MQIYKNYPGMEGAVYYYYAFPKNPMNDWLVAEHQKRFNAPPDFFTAGGVAAGAAGFPPGDKGGRQGDEEVTNHHGGEELQTPEKPEDLPHGGNPARPRHVYFK